MLPNRLRVAGASDTPQYLDWTPIGLNASDLQGKQHNHLQSAVEIVGPLRKLYNQFESTLAGASVAKWSKRV